MSQKDEGILQYIPLLIVCMGNLSTVKIMILSRYRYRPVTILGYRYPPSIIVTAPLPHRLSSFSPFYTVYHCF